MDIEKLQQLTSKYLRGEATPEEKQLLDEWYYSFEGRDLPVPLSVGEKMRNTLHRVLFRKRRQRWAYAAAASVLLASACLYLFRPVNKIINVPVAAQLYKTLEDSSKLWINAASTVSYHKPRELTLNGEAFFDVAHDPSHPFTIHIRDITVTVLGTAFNIKAYPNEPVTVTVTRGKVKVEGYGHTSIITPGEQVTATASTWQQQTAKPAIAESWKDGSLEFTNERFDEIAATLQRRFGVKIIFEDTSLQSLRFTAGFDKTQTVEDILNALNKINQTHWKKDDHGNLWITP